MRNERIPCPDCGESIPSIAKKCRFCGAVLIKEQTPISLQASYLVWFSTLLIFFTLILSMWGIDATNSAITSRLIRFLALDVIVGLVAFLILFERLFSKIQSKFRKQYGILTLTTLIVFFLLLFKSESVAAKFGLSTPQKTQPFTTTVNSVASPTPTPKINVKPTTANSTKINQIDCTGPDGKVFKTTQKECDDFNAAWGNNQNKQTNPGNNSNLLSCNLSYGTYNLTQENCDYYKKLDSTTGSKTYYQPTYTYDQDYGSISPNQTVVPINNAELRSECLGDLQSLYQQEMSALNQKIRVISASTYEYESSQIKKRYESAEQDCKSRYPI